MSNKIKFGIAAVIILGVVITSYTATNLGTQATSTKDVTDVLRVGYFPNINHAQAVIGLTNGDFQKELGDVKIETQVFNAGPSAVEALFANRIDATYIGPNPAINGYIKSDGEALRIVSGAASAGAAFVVRADSGIESVNDLAGKKFASPQLGNTQDVALRSYLLKNGYETTENKGNVEVTPAANPDILTLMTKKEIDGAWVPEPWVTKLVKEANGRILVDERNLWPEGRFVTSHIIVRTDYLEKHPDIIKKLIQANVDETIWINSNKGAALKSFNSELEKLTGKTIPEDVLTESLSRMELTYDPIRSSLYKSADDAFALGFLGEKKPDLTEIYDLKLLNEVLREKGLQIIP